MLSRFSQALLSLLCAALIAFLWALTLLYHSTTLAPDQVDWLSVSRNLLLSIVCFVLMAVAAHLPVRKSVAVKLTLGLGLTFLGVWQELLNGFIITAWPWASLLMLTLAPVGLAIAALGLYQLGQHYRMNRLMLGSYRNIEQNLSTIDQLTQLYNRRCFFTRGNERFEQALLEGKRPVLVALRLTNLTDLNLALGFECGDDVLISVSRAIKRYLPPGAMAARMGGRRFSLLMTDTGEPEARALMKQISDRLKHVLLRNEQGEEVLTQVNVEYQLTEARPGDTLARLLGDLRPADGAKERAAH